MDRVGKTSPGFARGWCTFSRSLFWIILNIVRSSLVDAYSYSRSKDFEGSGGSALGKAMSTDPWYKEIVPNVGSSLCVSSTIGTAHTVL